MEELVFKTLATGKEFSNIDNLINDIVKNSYNVEITFDEVKESVLKLILYGFIKVDTSNEVKGIIKKDNFYEALEIGGVSPWLKRKRSLSVA
ncbi:hypothetical protein BTO06_08680 [Tenacibaculum sp. SZ-18]|uniref:hypothetical protein n=1 Tax=Tenacibaculum sp. SZ-18 TaxID=754423 RepID=UPI000C2D3FFA|nr:hypothetical protein [Tenacibaculum sp. SZ-18]AUC15207.1 hypothetical protein BTO06_08680 [Tenacibaculum sp. SZ-18]